jgi:hypothetical protein
MHRGARLEDLRVFSPASKVALTRAGEIAWVKSVPALLVAVLLGALAGCGGGTVTETSGTTTAGTSRSGVGTSGRRAGPAQGSSASAGTPAAVAPVRAVAAKPPSKVPLVSSPSHTGPEWRVVATIAGQPAAWIAERSGVTLMRFDQSLVRLALHAGSGEPAGGGWRYGSDIGPHEVHRVVAGFNGGFRLSYGSVGFMADGRAPVPLSAGLGSIVIYNDGVTDVGAWQAGVPAHGRAIESVLQDLRLLVDHGTAAATVETCAIECWGSTLGGGVAVARSALGVREDGQLVWAAGESLSPAAIARALIDARAQRAVELDINPEWVAGYLYLHHGGPVAMPVVPGQAGIPGQLLAPYSRDFFTVLAR